MDCLDCGTVGRWCYAEKESAPAPRLVAHSLAVRFKENTDLVLIVAHCDNCGGEEEFFGELPRVERHGFSRESRTITQHERARWRPGSVPMLVRDEHGDAGNMVWRSPSWMWEGVAVNP